MKVNDLGRHLQVKKNTNIEKRHNRSNKKKKIPKSALKNK